MTRIPTKSGTRTVPIEKTNRSLSMKRSLFLSLWLVTSPALMLAQSDTSEPSDDASAIQAPEPASCLPDTGAPCYTPQQLRDAYGLTPLIKSGYDGSGQTIVIIESFGSPTIEADLKAFDAAYNLPDPPSIKVLAPLGTVPFDPTDNDQVAWAFETTLDVEWAHAMAPGANIIVLTSPVDETQGVQGLPEFLQLEKYALDNHLGQIISQSWGTTENTLFDREGRKVMHEFQKLYQRAAAEHVTVLAGAGDSGTSNVDTDGNIYDFPTVLFPASSPFVLAVGGTTLQADSSGLFSGIVWNDQNGVTGGGTSQMFGQPAYQRGLSPAIDQQLAGHRGLPDVVANADPVYIYVGFYSDPANNGFYTNGGTSE